MNDTTTENTGGMPTMPTMPTAPSLSAPTHEETTTPAAPVQTAPEVKPVSKPALLIPAGGIKVKALRKGFFNNIRIAEGQPFAVPFMEALGSWMECEDKDFQKAHEKMMKEKQEASDKELAERAKKAGN